MDDELHAAGLVEEALEHELLLRRHRAEHGPADGEVVDDHRGGLGVDAGGVDQPLAGAVGVAGRRGARRRRRAASDTSSDSSAVRAGASPIQNGIVRRRVAGVAHPHDAGLDPADLPRVGAEQEDVARHRLDRPVLVDGADEGVVGLGHDAVVAVLGDRAARRGGGEARALATAQLAVDRVVVHVGARVRRDRSRCRCSRGRRPRRTARGSARCRARRGGRARRGRRSSTPARRLRRRSAGRRCRAAASAAGWRRAGRPAPRRAARRTRRARRGSVGRAVPSACPTGCGSSGRRAAGTWRCCAASRSGTPAPPARCRCRARATRWRRAPAGRRRAGASRPGSGAPSTGCRGARRRRRRPGARRAGARAARPAAGC